MNSNILWIKGASFDNCNSFIYTAKNGTEVETYLLWQNGKPALWADGDDVLILRDDFTDAAGLRKIGTEIAAAFNITEEA